MAYDIIAETEKPRATDAQSKRKQALVAWITGKVRPWRDYRDTNFKQKWDEYYRLWRGVWTNEDKTRESERSKLISPALQQAIEATVAELEEATFGKGTWFDIADDVADQQPENLMELRRRLSEDFEFAKVKSAVSEIYLNGALYGTGIGKIVVEKEKEKVIFQGYNEEVMQNRPDVAEDERFVVRLVPIDPRNFIIDPAAKSIDEAMGMAHETTVPTHTVVKKQKAGIYYDIDLGDMAEADDVSGLGENTRPETAGQTKILEYHGLVPKKLLPRKTEEDEFVFMPDDAYDMVEAIVTIGNGAVVLREKRNPLLMQDRGFIAYQHDTVPNRFWGRGVAEKGYNPQKALDAELRARIDGLALTVHPMMAGDATRLPRGFDLSVRPGRQILTNGDPRTVLMPFNFGQIDQNTFANASDLERMIQMGTGAMDSATPTAMNARNNTASGMSMIMSGMIKRSKRTMQNIAEHLLEPFVRKALWRYIQFNQERYPVKDYKFVITSTMGLMAREFQSAQLTQLMQTVPPESPIFLVLLKTLFENASLSNKEEVMALIDQAMQRMMNPPEPQPDPAEQMKEQARMITAENDRIRAQNDTQRVMLEKERNQIAMLKEQFDQQIRKFEAVHDAILSIAKAESQEAGTQIEAYKAQLEPMNGPSGSEAL